MATPCQCDQATSAPVCDLIAGPGTIITGTNPQTVSSQSAQPWTAFLPTFTNFTLGNGTNASRYLLNGKTLDVIYVLQLGTTSAFNANEMTMALPAGTTAFITTLAAGHNRANASAFDNSSASPWWEGETVLRGNNQITARFEDDAGGAADAQTLRATIPFTWANLDKLCIQIRLEVN